MADINTDQKSGLMALYELLNKPLRAHFSVAAPAQEKNKSGLVLLSDKGTYIGVSYQQGKPKEAVIQPKIKTEHIDISALAQKFEAVSVKKPITIEVPELDFDWAQSMLKQKDVTSYFQNQKSIFQVSDEGTDFTPAFKWGGNTWFGLSGESKPVGTEKLKGQEDGVQSRFFEERTLPEKEDDILDISGEAYIKYESKDGMTVRFGVTPPIQDIVDERAVPETKWNMQIKIPLKP